MNQLNLDDVKEYVERNIGDFHRRRIESLDTLKLSKVLKKKNPYLFKAKHVLTAEHIVKGLVDAHISSNEETIFGDWLEGLAIFVNGKVYNGWKSGIAGVDLEFDRDGARYIVNIKSGPNWANSRTIPGMIRDFNAARKTFSTSNSKLTVVAVNGCCYGTDNKHVIDKNYYKYCGQRFWEFISGSSDLYLKIIEPLGHKAREKNEEFMESYSKMINKFTMEFGKEFYRADGSIDWEKLVVFNSGENRKKR